MSAETFSRYMCIPGFVTLSIEWPAEVIAGASTSPNLDSSIQLMTVLDSQFNSKTENLNTGTNTKPGVSVIEAVVCLFEMHDTLIQRCTQIELFQMEKI